MIEPARVLQEGPLIMDLGVLHKVFTPERVRLLGSLREAAAPSLAALAARLDRRPPHVSRDVTYLEGVGLLRRSKHGRTTRIEAIHRPILIE